MAKVTTEEQKFYSELSKNVVALESARKKVNSQINEFLRKDDDFSVALYTKIYLLIYSSWTEAYLVKLVHTPSGFTATQKKSILSGQDVINKWKKCVNTAFNKFEKKGSDVPNKKQKIHKLLDEYLKTQANIRNKIAHGQWVFPLYKNNLAHDPDAQTLINLIDVIQIDTWFEVFKEISEIVRGLIDAKHRNNHLSHYNYYFERIVKIQEIIMKRRKYTIQDKKILLKKKPRFVETN